MESQRKIWANRDALGAQNFQILVHALHLSLKIVDCFDSLKNWASYTECFHPKLEGQLSLSQSWSKPKSKNGRLF